MSNLRTEREALAQAESRSYDPDAFPGSARWMKNNNAARALAAFDAEHPEIVAELKAEKEAARKAKFDAMSDFAKNGS